MNSMGDRFLTDWRIGSPIMSHFSFVILLAIWIVGIFPKPSGNLLHSELERSTIFNGKIHYKWPFSIAMLNYQRVIIWMWVKNHYPPMIHVEWMWVSYGLNNPPMIHVDHLPKQNLGDWCKKKGLEYTENVRHQIFRGESGHFSLFNQWIFVRWFLGSCSVVKAYPLDLSIHIA